MHLQRGHTEEETSKHRYIHIAYGQEFRAEKMQVPAHSPVCTDTILVTGKTIQRQPFDARAHCG